LLQMFRSVESSLCMATTDGSSQHAPGCLRKQSSFLSRPLQPTSINSRDRSLFCIWSCHYSYNRYS
jgi:hypothetical protein